MKDEPGQVTVLLRRWNDGDADARDQLISFVYPRLHQIAAGCLRRESDDHTLQPTALVHELYLKLLQQRKADWGDRYHFYVFAAKVMRRILADHARAVNAEKRGSGLQAIPLSEDLPWIDLNSTDLIDINRLLDELEAVDARKVRLVELRYFVELYGSGVSLLVRDFGGDRGTGFKYGAELDVREAADVDDARRIHAFAVRGFDSRLRDLGIEANPMKPPGEEGLTPERWQRMESIFNAALEVEGSGRTEFLRRACDGDSTLREQVENLLSASSERQTFVRQQRPAPRLHATVFGSYTIDREIGHGGMGTVYLAHRSDGQFEQCVALKVVSAHLSTQFFADRFRAERQILAQLNHPNITRLLDGGVTPDGDPYLAMEYVDGEPLDRYCDRLALSVAERIQLFLQICSAVEYAHRNLVIHRDLKPGNIFVTSGGSPKLLDFGTAKLLTVEDGNGGNPTRFGMLTPRYASPEQLRGEPVSTLSDLFSLGVMLYELVTGAWPFGDPHSPLDGMERAVRDTEPSRPSSVIDEEAARVRSTSKAKLAHLVDGDLRNILEKAIETSPQSRYQSVEQFSSDLQRYLAGQPVLARPQTALYRAGKFVRRNWIAVAGAMIFVLGLSLVAAIAVYQARVAKKEAARAQAVTQFLQDVIYAGDPEDVRDRTVLAAMEIARERLNSVRNQPEVELPIRVALGYVYAANSRLPEAEKELRRAEKLARQTGNPEMLASALYSLSQVLYHFADSRAALMEAVQIASDPGKDLPPTLRANIFSEAGQALGFEQHSPYVEHLLREAVRISHSDTVPRSVYITSLSFLGQYLRYENRLDEAERTLNECMGLVSAHPTVSSNLALEQLGTIRIKRGDLQGGESYYRRRRDLMMRLAGPDNGTTMDARSRWSMLLARMGRIPEALQEMGDNLGHSRKAFAAGSFGLWFAVSAEANILNLAGRPEDALPLAREAVACFGAPTSRTDLRLAQVESELGIALTKLRNYREARPYLEDAFRIFSQDPSLGPSDYRTLRVKTYLDQTRLK